MRRESFSTAVLNTLREALASELTIERFDIGTLPLYNADLDGDHPPEPVRALKSAIAASQGLLIVSPEYSYGVPGVLKNALDWASRPAYQSVLKDKLAGIISVSRSFTGGVRAQGDLKRALYGSLARTLPWQEVVIGMVQDKVKNGKLTDETSLKFSLDLVRGLANEIRAR